MWRVSLSVWVLGPLVDFIYMRVCALLDRFPVCGLVLRRTLFTISCIWFVCRVKFGVLPCALSGVPLIPRPSSCGVGCCCKPQSQLVLHGVEINLCLGTHAMGLFCQLVTNHILILNNDG